MCVCVRERERERERLCTFQINVSWTYLLSSLPHLQWAIVCLIYVEGILQGVGVQADRLKSWMESHALQLFRKLIHSIQNLLEYVQ